jgi:hypothetical protein
MQQAASQRLHFAVDVGTAISICHHICLKLEQWNGSTFWNSSGQSGIEIRSLEEQAAGTFGPQGAQTHLEDD